MSRQPSEAAISPNRIGLMIDLLRGVYTQVPSSKSSSSRCRANPWKLSRIFDRPLLANRDQVWRRRLRDEDAAVGDRHAQHENPVTRALSEAFAFVDAVDENAAHDHHHRHQRR